MALELVGLALYGSRYAYSNGVYYPGWATARLSDGTTRYVPEEHAGWFDAALSFIERHYGLDCSDYRRRLDVWVQTGIMPARQA